MELRNRLFSALLNQEVAFFDSHMTGEIVSRLTADIQEFKSSFKQCVSQGLRSVSQVLGCVLSLYFVSKEMTATIIAVVPGIILLGTIFTRGLRKLSRKAQVQVKIIGLCYLENFNLSVNAYSVLIACKCLLIGKLALGIFRTC